MARVAERAERAGASIVGRGDGEDEEGADRHARPPVSSSYSSVVRLEGGCSHFSIAAYAVSYRGARRLAAALLGEGGEEEDERGDGDGDDGRGRDGLRPSGARRRRYLHEPVDSAVLRMVERGELVAFAALPAVAHALAHDSSENTRRYFARDTDDAAALRATFAPGDQRTCHNDHCALVFE